LYFTFLSSFPFIVYFSLPKTMVVWVTTLGRITDGRQRLGVNYFIFRAEEEHRRSKVLRNIGNNLPDYMMPMEPEILNFHHREKPFHLVSHPQNYSMHFHHVIKCSQVRINDSASL
jgi:hypothetical protein